VGILLCATFLAGAALGERKQRGQVIASLDGGVSPLRLPRNRPVPVTVHLEGGLRTADGSQLPRVTSVELGLPPQGLLDTRGLPACTVRRLRNRKSPAALAACRSALVGHGRLEAEVVLPGQAPFSVHARLLVFNGVLSGGRHAILLHGYAVRPPTVVVLPLVVRRRGGRFPTALIGHMPAALGPWPRFAHFEMTIGRSYRYRGARRSFLSGSCPIPPRFTAGFLSFASATYTLASGRSLAVEIVRGCRGR
jgi:hypothetical protein